MRGIGRDYLHGIYETALRPDLTFWLNVRPEVAFDREFKKSQTISYWESGRDMSLSNDLFQSFIRYQSHDQARIRISIEAAQLHRNGRRKQRLRSKPRCCANALPRISGSRSTHYQPSHALSHLWR